MNHILNGIIFAGAVVSMGCQGLQAAPPLAIGTAGITTLASDGDHVYWTALDGSVQRVSVAGGTVEQVASGVGQAQYIALDSDSVYWATNGGQIGSVSKSGGSPQMLVENEDGLGALQVDDTAVYWLVGPGQTTASGQVRRMVKTPGASVETLAEANLVPGTLALSGSLYYPVTGTSAPGDAVTPGVCAAQAPGAQVQAACSAVLALSTSGGTPVADVTGSFHFVAASSSTLCSAGFDAQAQLADPTSSTQAITCTGLDGSNPVLVANGLANFVGSMAVDASNVYFVTTDGTATSAPLDTAAPITPINTGTACGSDTTCAAPASTGPQSFALGATSVAVDPFAVYWSQGNAIFSMPTL